MTLEDKQKNICEKFCFISILRFGFKSWHFFKRKDGVRPINGLRVREENETSGWYIWAGDWSDDPDFFVPLHGEHLNQWAAIVMPYLGLPEGWRFLITEDYEDVWEDLELLNN